MITLEKSKEEYHSLIPNDQHAVKQILLQFRQQYIMSGMTVDIPYFFFSIHKPMFRLGEEKEFLKIANGGVFSYNSIFLISRFIKETRRGTQNE